MVACGVGEGDWAWTYLGAPQSLAHADCDVTQLAPVPDFRHRTPQTPVIPCSIHDSVWSQSPAPDPEPLRPLHSLQW